MIDSDQGLTPRPTVRSQSPFTEELSHYFTVSNSIRNDTQEKLNENSAKADVRRRRKYPRETMIACRNTLIFAGTQLRARQSGVTLEGLTGERGSRSRTGGNHTRLAHVSRDQLSKKAAARPPRRPRLGGTAGGSKVRGQPRGWKGDGDERGGAVGGSQFFTGLRMRPLLYPTNGTAALAFLKAS